MLATAKLPMGSYMHSRKVMPKKLLIISPAPTHPADAGNRRGILSLAENLRQQGFDIYFFLLDYEEGNRAEMEAWWGKDKIWFIDRDIIFGKGSIYERGLAKCRRIWSRIKKRGALIIGSINREAWQYNSYIDDHYPIVVDKYIRQVQKQVAFDAVIATYVFYSHTLQLFSKHIPKVIDSHDIFSNRYKQYLDKGRAPQWISLFPQEEKKGFDRAGMVLSVQENEINYIRSLGVKAKPLLVGHRLAYQPLPSILGHRLLFVSSHNDVNIDGINDFIDHVFPLVQARFPASELLIAGNICRKKDKIRSGEGIVFLGEFEHIQEAYAQGGIVICPIQAGTGIKVKLIEALSFGKAVVATSVAAEGLEKYAGQYFLVGGNAEQMAGQILLLWENPARQQELEKGCQAFCEAYNQSSQLQELYNYLNSGTIDGK
ncbi:MAG: glycosyltransferase [Bacteroidetes bacterium]|nr:glycosyltransferase [Bacteroidota bacterium]